MKRSSDIIYLQIFLTIKLLATVLMVAFPQALLTLLCPLGIFSPFLVGAMAYADLSKVLLTLFVVLVIVSTVLLVVFSLCIIVNPRCSGYFALILIICYALEGVSCILSLIFGNLVLANIVGIAFNAVVVKLLWRVRWKTLQSRKTGDGSVS